MLIATITVRDPHGVRVHVASESIGVFLTWSIELRQMTLRMTALMTMTYIRLKLKCKLKSGPGSPKQNLKRAITGWTSCCLVRCVDSINESIQLEVIPSQSIAFVLPEEK